MKFFRRFREILIWNQTFFLCGGGGHFYTRSASLITAFLNDTIHKKIVFFFDCFIFNILANKIEIGSWFFTKKYSSKFIPWSKKSTVFNFHPRFILSGKIYFLLLQAKLNKNICRKVYPLYFFIKTHYRLFFSNEWSEKQNYWSRDTMTYTNSVINYGFTRWTRNKAV